MFDSDFEFEVYDFLCQQRFELDSHVESCGFVIDLAVKYPHTSDYILAIECDGATYHFNKSARDHDDMRQKVLENENHGWEFFRVCSSDWMFNNAKTKKRLFKAINKAINDNKPKQKLKTQQMIQAQQKLKEQQERQKRQAQIKLLLNTLVFIKEQKMPLVIVIEY